MLLSHSRMAFTDWMERFSGCFCFLFFCSVCNAVFPKVYLLSEFMFFVTKMENSFLITHGQLAIRAEMSLPDLRTLTTHSYSFQASKLIQNERKNRQISKFYILCKNIYIYFTEFLFHSPQPAVFSLLFIFCPSCDSLPNLFNSSIGPYIINCSTKFGFTLPCLPGQKPTRQQTK